MMQNIRLSFTGFDWVRKSNLMELLSKFVGSIVLNFSIKFY